MGRIPPTVEEHRGGHQQEDGGPPTAEAGCHEEAGEHDGKESENEDVRIEEHEDWRRGGPPSVVAISPGICRYRHGRKHPCPLQFARFLASAQSAPRQQCLFNAKPETGPAAAWRAAPGLFALCRGRTTRSDESRVGTMGGS